MDLGGVADGFAMLLRDGGQTLVGLGGLAVAGLTVWLGHRERTKELRQRLFDARVQASESIAAAAWKLYDATIDDAETIEYGSGPSTQMWGEGWARSFRGALAFREQVKRFDVLLDANTTEALSKFEAAASRVSGYPYPWGNDADWSNESVDALRVAYQALIESLRQMLGVDLLGQETLRMLGKPRPERRPRTDSRKEPETDPAAPEQHEWS